MATAARASVDVEDKPGPKLAELVQRAQTLVPVLRERSARCEELRQIPPETVADVRAAEFHRIAQPVPYGGLGLLVDDAGEVAMEIGRGCCSTAWLCGLWPSHNFMVGMFTEEAQKEYWAGSFDTLASTASAVVKLSAEQVDGGLRVSAQLRYSSGCDYADWLIIVIPAGMCLLPKSDFRIEDDWFVMGLRGTGSKAVVIEDVFVPPHRFVPMELLMSGRSPGAELYPENPYYRISMGISLTPTLVGPIIGMAKGLLELFDERVVKRIDLHTGMRACERPGTQLRYAEASAGVDAAVLVLGRVNQMLREWGSAGRDMPLAEPRSPAP